MARHFLVCMIVCSRIFFGQSSNVYWHRIKEPADVLGSEPELDQDHWGVVDFEPVPAFSMDTHDPITQDIFISASVHQRVKPWDSYIWDRIVSLTKGSLANKTATFVDVGANLGYFTLAASSLGYNVISFEPMSRNAKKLAKSIQKNHFHSKVKLYQNVVSNETGQQTKLRETDTSNQGNGQIVSDVVAVAGGVYGIDFVTSVALSDMLEGQDAYIVKIDVEGRETDVIAGAREWICNNTVKHIIVEISDATKANTVFPLSQMLNFMERAGYVMSDVAVGSDTLGWTDKNNLPPNLIFTLEHGRALC